MAVPAMAQSDEFWIKYSPEVRINHLKSNTEFRWRPIDHIAPLNISRFDFMLGKVLGQGRFKIFSYSKFDTRGNSVSEDIRWRYWTGIRIDNNTFAFDKKLLMHFQYRYFTALNDAAINHQYFIQLIDYKVLKNMKAGVLGFAKKNKGRDPFWFVGPLLTTKYTKHISTMTGLCKDVLGQYDYLLFLRLNFKFKIGLPEGTTGR